MKQDKGFVRKYRMRSCRRVLILNSQSPFPSGATHGWPKDIPCERSISIPTMVSTFSSLDSASIKDSTGDLPLASRKQSMRQSTGFMLLDISCDSKRETRAAGEETSHKGC